MRKTKKWLRKWLGLEDIEANLESVIDTLFDRDARMNGFLMLRKRFMTEEELDKLSWMGKPVREKPEDRQGTGWLNRNNLKK